MDLSLAMRLENYIRHHCYPAYTISQLAPIYLVGGAIRDLIYAKKPKNMDFVVLGKEQLDWVMKARSIPYSSQFKQIPRF